MKIQAYGSAEPRYYLHLTSGCGGVTLAIVDEKGQHITSGDLMYITKCGVRMAAYINKDAAKALELPLNAYGELVIVE